MNRFAPCAARGGGRVTHRAYFVPRQFPRNNAVLVVVQSLRLCLCPNGLLIGENEKPLDLLRPGRRAPAPVPDEEGDRWHGEADHRNKDQAPKP